MSALNMVDERHWAEAAELSGKAIDLLPLMNRRSLSRDDQQHTLTMFAGLAAISHQ